MALPSFCPSSRTANLAAEIDSESSFGTRRYPPGVCAGVSDERAHTKKHKKGSFRTSDILIPRLLDRGKAIQKNSSLRPRSYLQSGISSIVRMLLPADNLA